MSAHLDGQQAQPAGPRHPPQRHTNPLFSEAHGHSRAPMKTQPSLKRLRLLAIGTLFFANVASAQFQLPPAPDDLPPSLAGEIAFDVRFPISPGTICPTGADCVLGGGLGLAGALRLHYPSGIAIGGALSVDFLDGNSVHEITTTVELGFNIRKAWLSAYQTHPFIEGEIGAVMLSDVFFPVAVGAAIDLRIGVASELSNRVSLISSLGVRLFSTSPYTSEADGVDRSSSFGIASIIQFRVGLLLYARDERQ